MWVITQNGELVKLTQVGAFTVEGFAVFAMVQGQWVRIGDRVPRLMPLLIELLSRPAQKNAVTDLRKHYEQWHREEEIAAGVQSLPVPPVPLAEVDGLSGRTLNALRFGGMVTLRDVAAQTEVMLLNVRNLGQKSLDEVRAALAQYDFALPAE